MAKVWCLVATVVLATAAPSQGQTTEQGLSNRGWFVGSSVFMLGNVALEESPSFYQLNVGNWLTSKDVVSVEAITWRYTAPLGIPYGNSAAAKRDRYPGSVRSAGVGLAYQRYWLRGLYSAIHVTAFRQNYRSQGGNSPQSGFQLFTTARLGYHIDVLNRRVFLEPSIAVTAWPVNTNRPAAFQSLDDKWHSYFLGEPGLHFGVRF